jgi:hypothetical protein
LSWLSWCGSWSLSWSQWSEEWIWWKSYHRNSYWCLRCISSGSWSRSHSNCLRDTLCYWGSRGCNWSSSLLGWSCLSSQFSMSGLFQLLNARLRGLNWGSALIHREIKGRRVNVGWIWILLGLLDQFFSIRLQRALLSHRCLLCVKDNVLGLSLDGSLSRRL